MRASSSTRSRFRSSRRRPPARPAATARTRTTTSTAATPSRAASPTSCARLARDNPDVAKLVEIGKSLLGKPILAIKITDDARNVPDGTRPAVLYGAVNHAREWIAAEVARREAKWFLEHKNDPRVAGDPDETTELWFLPVYNPDGYDYTFTCGTGAPRSRCGPGDGELQPPVAQDAARQQQRRHLRQRRRRRRPQPQLPRAVGARQRGLEPDAVGRGLPRPVRELRARERRLRPAPPPDQADLQPQLPLGRAAAETARSASSPTVRPTTTRSRAR